MKTSQDLIPALSDAGLIAEVQRLVHCERSATAALLRSLMEFDTRKLYLGEGYPSLFAYCTRVLHYSEHAALNRIEVTRTARRFPILLAHVADGGLHLTGARLLAPLLTEGNAEALLAAARHKSKREIEELIAGLRPRPVIAPTVRKLPSPRPSTVAAVAPGTDSERLTARATASSPPPVVTLSRARAIVAPLAPERFKVQFTITRETRDKLRQVQDLMRNALPDGNPAAIFDRALTMLLEALQRKRFAATSKPKPSGSGDAQTRHIPAAVRRTVWQRDDGCCAFVGSKGRCGERASLEFHHVVPFALGGTATVDNIELRCRAHNAYEASLFLSADNVTIVREVAGGYGDH